MAEFAFTKSSYSGGGDLQSDCVEVARNVPGVVAVRDSKDPHREMIRLSPEAWAAFLSGVGGVSG